MYWRLSCKAFSSWGTRAEYIPTGFYSNTPLFNLIGSSVKTQRFDWSDSDAQQNLNLTEQSCGINFSQLFGSSPSYSNFTLILSP